MSQLKPVKRREVRFNLDDQQFGNVMHGGYSIRCVTLGEKCWTVVMRNGEEVTRFFGDDQKEYPLPDGYSIQCRSETNIVYATIKHLGEKVATLFACENLYDNRRYDGYSIQGRIVDGTAYSVILHDQKSVSVSELAADMHVSEADVRRFFKYDGPDAPFEVRRENDPDGCFALLMWGCLGGFANITNHGNN